MPFYGTEHIFNQPLLEFDGERSCWLAFGCDRDRWQRTPEGWPIQERSFKSVHPQGQAPPPDQAQASPKPPSA